MIKARWNLEIVTSPLLQPSSNSRLGSSDDIVSMWSGLKKIYFWNLNHVWGNFPPRSHKSSVQLAPTWGRRRQPQWRWDLTEEVPDSSFSEQSRPGCSQDGHVTGKPVSWARAAWIIDSSLIGDGDVPVFICECFSSCHFCNIWPYLIFVNFGTPPHCLCL